VAAYEISKMLPYAASEICTPNASIECKALQAQPVLATILRAGLPLYQGLLNFFDQADSAFIGAYRKHNTDNSFEIAQGYMACPALAGRPLIMADPMLATGASIIRALTSILEYDTPTQLHIVSVVAAPEGIEALLQSFPEAHMWVGAIDTGLDERKYIVPGLGDAGDLCYGEKRQH
jgi:uracil phosphoribosyltransferase